MALPTTIKFGKFFVRLSDGAETPTFAAPCGFTSKSFNRTKTFGETNLPDCDNPDLAPWSVRDTQSRSGSITGEGVLAKSAVPAWEAAFASEDSIECEVEFEYPDGDSDIYTGAFHLESFEITGTRGERVTASISMQSDGQITYERTTGA